MITIVLENLRNGNIRATGMIEGRTVTFIDSTPGQESTIVRQVMRETAPGHQISINTYDLTYIRMNDAAKKAFDAAK